MAFLDYFRSRRNSSATQAKDRLQVIVAHQRSMRNGESKLDSPEYLQCMQTEILEVIKKYIEIDQDQVKVELAQNEDCSVIELNLTLPEAHTV